MDKAICQQANLITMDTTPFDPKVFIGPGWSIVDDDERANALREIDFSKIIFETTLLEGEKYVKGEDRLRRLKSILHRIRLGAVSFKNIWGNRHLIPDVFREKINGNIRFLFFDGSILQDSTGRRHSLCMWADGSGWHWTLLPLAHKFTASSPSVTYQV